MKKSSVYGILASFLAFVSLAACCELILRLTGYGDAQNIVTSDPYLGYRLSPGTHAKLLGVEVGVSKQGFRDRLHDIQKEPGRERFVFVGDSQTLGHGVRPEEAFPQRVADSAGVETINMGCPGWGPDQYLLFLEHYGLEYRPDVAVMAVSIGSDLSDLLDPLDDKFIVDKFS
ncbi:MAG: hypothetical protein WCG06_04815, partial [Candidatus Omnitrophota bacterium]